MGLVATSLVAFTTRGLLDVAERHFRAANVAADLHGDVTRLVAVSRRLAAAQPETPALAREAVTEERAVRDGLARLRRSRFETDRVLQLRRTVDAYLATFDRERVAAAAGDGAAATALADVADDAYGRLTPQALSIVHELRRDAYRASYQTRNLVVGLTVGVLAGVVVLLSWWGRRLRHRAERVAANRSKVRFDAVVERSRDLTAVVDRHGRLEYASPSIGKVMGRDVEEILGLDLDALMGDVVGTAAAEHAAIFEQLLTSPGGSATFEYSIRDAEGQVRQFEVIGTNLLDEPDVRGVVLNSRDITERAEFEQELRDREANFRVLFDDNPQPMWVLDDETHRFLRVNDAASEQYGYARSEFAAMSVIDLSPVEDREELSRDLEQRTRMHRPAAVWRHQTKDGRLLDVELRSHHITFDGQGATLFLAQDVTERRRLEAALEHRAFHDPLTELPNRALFRDRLLHALAAASRDDFDVCVLLLDFDGFKTVNDTLGHAAGDELLDRAARRLQACLRAGDTIARMGGDEFAVLLEGGNADESSRLADRLLEALREPFTIAGQEIFLTASVGVAASGHRAADTATRTELLREADLAMYAAKDAGRNRSSVFQPFLKSRATERLTLQADLQHAVPRNQLRLYYQPTVELDTLKIVGFEALLRWDHPERGLIPPSEFISLAEETGLIVPVGRWVLYEACRQVGHWQRTISGYEELGIAINVSGRQLQAREAVSDISDAIGAASLDPAAVTIEITESLFLTDTEAVRNQMQALKQLGVRLAIDDFGTGYSSLSYLSRFPLDVMKIDKSFLVDVCSSADRHAFLRSIIDMGHTLHLSTLGEGIENDSELELLRACGCDLGQGFLFARPLTPDQATKQLTETATPRHVTAA